ncbi:hypothetical protein [Erwinia mallotivora]|uniref:hypothetical protein n=1 Tax=Erwinia mallotivora TaxID=69222 RepID=UPI0021BEE808|nr:hypothetical protein [Erwinia mallotivora]
MLRALFFFSSVALLTGCTSSDWAAVNRQVSDTAGSLTKTLQGRGENGGLPLMSLAQQPERQSVDNTFSLPVDVDTAAARLKRHYQFTTPEDTASLRSQGRDGAWKASAVDDTHPVWDSTPGSHYKMGSDWNGSDHLDIELEKNGAGTQAYVVYRSSSPARLAGSGVQRLMSDIRAVAAGEKR